MVSNESSKTKQVEVAIGILNQALNKLLEHDYVSAQVMTAVARQMLDDLNQEFEHHFLVQERLKRILNRPSK
jgi:hypothetical protein